MTKTARANNTALLEVIFYRDRVNMKDNLDRSKIADRTIANTKLTKDKIPSVLHVNEMHNSIAIDDIIII